MRLLDLGAVYLLVGLVCAVAAARRPPPRPSASDLTLALFVWPVYVPVLLSDARTSGPSPAGERPREFARLVDALAAVGDPTLASLLPTPEQLAPLADQLERLDAKVAELDEVLERERQESHAQRRSGPQDAHARLVQDSLVQLQSLRSRAARERGELLALCGRLRMQVTVLRFAGRAPEDVGDLVSQILGRIEGVGAAFESDIDGAREPARAPLEGAAPERPAGPTDGRGPRALGS